jgi:PAS domain S-box-containing protein
MSALFWLDVAALGTSLLISSSLALMVLGFGPGRALNRWFVLFASLEATWAGFSLLLRLSLWLERGDPLLFGELATLTISLMSVALLMFAVRYVRRRGGWADIAAVLGVALTSIVLVPLFQHRLVFNPRLQANGSTTLDLSTWGLLAAIVPATFFVWSLVLFWRARHRTGESYLAIGVLIMVAGFFLGGVLEVALPVLSVTNTLGVAVLGYGIASRQLFNPLRESEERFRTIFDGLNDAVFIHDVDTGAIVDVNAKMCDMYGYTREQALQLNVEALSSGEVPHTQREAMAWMRKALEGEPQLFEWQAKDSGGHLFWVEVNIRRAVIGGQERLLVTVRDITGRKRVEEVLHRRTAELEERNKELDAFAHTVAHDLQNTLGMVIGFADMLKESYSSLPERELQRYLRAIMRNGRRMSNIVDELLVLAGVRKVDLEAVPLDMARLVAGAEQRLADMIERYHAEIQVPGTWPVALGYGPWVEEIWVNYLSNALKYGGRPPHIELGTDRIKHGPGEQALIRFWIRDNGAGLTPEEQAKLFVPFTQLTQVEVKGHGLGLSIVQRIVEKLGGRAGVESAVGRGSLFWFTLRAP